MRSPLPVIVITSIMVTLSPTSMSASATEPSVEYNAATLSYCSAYHRQLTGRRRSVFEESAADVRLRFTNASPTDSNPETAAEMATVAGLDAETVGLTGGLWGGALVQALGEICGVSGWEPE